MVNEILDLLKKEYKIKEVDVGKYAKMKVGPMKFNIKKYEIEGIGSLGIMEGVAMLGMMKMDTIIFTSNEKDSPIFSYDYINAFGKLKVYLELYSAKVNQDLDYSKLNDLKTKYDKLTSFTVKPNWYDDIKYNECIYKEGKKKEKKEINNLILDYYQTFFDILKTANTVNKNEKIEKNKYYVDGLLKNGGPSTDMFVKQIGLEETKELFYNVLFNLK